MNEKIEFFINRLSKTPFSQVRVCCKTNIAHIWVKHVWINIGRVDDFYLTRDDIEKSLKKNIDILNDDNNFTKFYSLLDTWYPSSLHYSNNLEP